MEKILFTSESVSEGHPDKIADQISDAILDAYLAQDKNSRVACETFITTERVVVGGEIRSNAKIDVEKIVRDTIRGIGYTDKDLGIGADTCEVTNLLHNQSADIAMGVDESETKEIGAGDQGIMFGYATNETKGYMPLPIVIAHKLVRIASELRKSGDFKWSRPDMKSQVTIDYTDTNNLKVDTILMSIQHDGDYNEEEFKDYILKNILTSVIESFDLKITDETKVFINPTGRFVIGGPHGDAGLTGRKIIVDTYGGMGRHGGGAFSGKDSTKVDRSAAYTARYVAKNLVSAGFADKLEIQLSYAIGVVEPTSISVETFGTGKVENTKILDAIRNVFDLRPGSIIRDLGLNKPIFSKTAKYGHFGRKEFSWEALDKVEELKKYL